MRPSSSIFLFCVLLAAGGRAQSHEPALDFAKGPALWLMTADEQRAFRAARTEEEAQKLVDLFWVRRDPTPGTFANEFRDEFKERVQYADRRFREQGRRGALTERGRVLVVLGFPRELANEEGQNVAQMGVTATGIMDPTGGRQMADRSVWNYSYEEAIRFGLPKIEVVFIHDQTRGRARRDTHRNDFVSALPGAIRYWIKNPDLNEVPDWAKREIAMVALEPAESAAFVAHEAPLPDAPNAGAAASAAPAKAVAARPAGVGKLTLVKDAWAIQPQSGADPFVNIVSAEEFPKDGEMGWLVEKCSGSATSPNSPVEVKMKISGLINGERVNFNAPAEELTPDAIKASPGCYLVRGSVPLFEMDAGTYTLLVTVGGYNLTKEFRVIEE